MQKRYRSGVVAAALLMIASQSASAVTINFDEASANNNNTAVTNPYPSLGVSFGSDNSSTWGGLSRGDPGNWGIEGSNGAAFLGNNGINNGGTYVTTINFSSLASNVSFDVSRSNGSNAGQSLLASAFRGTTLLSTQSVLLGAINSWSSIAFGIGGIGSLIITGSTTGFSPFGIDNLQFTTASELLVSGVNQFQSEVTAIPEPETYALMLAGLGLLGFVARHKKNHLAAA